MNVLLFANNLTSGLVVIACWWLAHVNARARPPGRAIAAGYALIGIVVLFTALVRSLAIGPVYVTPWLIVITKTLLGATFLMTIYRRSQLGDR